MGIAKPRALTSSIGWIVVCCAIGLAIVAALHGQYGITWDEPVHSIYGDLVRAYFTSGGADQRANTFLNLYVYGPLVELIISVIHPANDRARYEVRHIVCGIFALVACAATWAFARQMSRRLVAPFALLALAMMPRFVGHAFDNLKDMPFATAMAVFMVAATRMNQRSAFQLRSTIVCGLAAGVAMAIRPGGLPIIAALLIAIALLADLTVHRDRDFRGSWQTTLARIAVALPIGWVVMILPWPYAHQSPLRHPLEAMAAAAAFPDAPTVLFNGTLMPSEALPRSYVLYMLLVTTAPFVLLLTFAGIFEVIRSWTLRDRSVGTFVLGVAATWFALPMVGMAAAHASVYDGTRHVLFIMPALALLAAVGGAVVVERMPGRFQPAAIAVVVAMLLSSAPALIRLHPYQSTYFNALVGGVGGADNRFDTDYWAASYGEALTWINERARSTPHATVRVAVAGTPYLEPVARLYAAPNVEVRVIERIGDERELPRDLDYCVATARWGFARQLFPHAPIVHSIGRDGAVFTVVRGR